jgi:hypothetical protein
MRTAKVFDAINKKRAINRPSTSNGFVWHKLNKNDDCTVLEWALDSPLDLMFSIALEESRNWDALEQADKLLNMLRCILPPRKKPDEWEFIVRVGRDCDFRDFRIVRVGTSQLGVGEYRTKYLSIAPRDWYSPKGNARAMKRFYEEFFGGRPTFEEMVAFVLREENFGLCVSSLHYD